MKKTVSLLLVLALFVLCSCEGERLPQETTPLATLPDVTETTAGPKEETDESSALQTTYPPATLPSESTSADTTEPQVTTAPDTETDVPMIDPDMVYSEGLVFVSYGDGTCYLAGMGDCTDLSVTIPPVSPEGDRVTAIGENAFYGNTQIKRVDIPAGVTEIQKYAFYGCSELVWAYFPDSLLEIGNGAFGYCEAFVPNLLSESLTKIGDGAFESCRFQTIFLPSSLTEIGAKAFYNCSYLDYVNIPDGVVSIGDEAFAACFSLKTVVLSESLLYVGANVFANVPMSVYTIYQDTYYIGSASNPYLLLVKPMEKKITDISIHENTKIIGASAFSQCLNLHRVELPESVEAIGDKAFFACMNLTQIDLGTRVKVIGEYAFYQCSMQSIFIPKSVIEIGAFAFSHCNFLTDAVLEGSGTVGVAAFSFTGLVTVTIYPRMEALPNQLFYCCDYLNDITFMETKAQWESLPKHIDWNYEMGGINRFGEPIGAYTIRCVDGDIVIEY